MPHHRIHLSYSLVVYNVQQWLLLHPQLVKGNCCCREAWRGWRGRWPPPPPIPHLGKSPLLCPWEASSNGPGPPQSWLRQKRNNPCHKQCHKIVAFHALSSGRFRQQMFCNSLRIRNIVPEIFLPTWKIIAKIFAIFFPALREIAESSWIQDSAESWIQDSAEICPGQRWTLSRTVLKSVQDSAESCPGQCWKLNQVQCWKLSRTVLKAESRTVLKAVQDSAERCTGQCWKLSRTPQSQYLINSTLHSLIKKPRECCNSGFIMHDPNYMAGSNSKSYNYWKNTQEKV